VPHRVKPSFAIFDIRALWRSECPDVKNYKWRLNPVLHRMLYSCTHMTTMGVKGLVNWHLTKPPPWSSAWVWSVCHSLREPDYSKSCRRIYLPLDAMHDADYAVTELSVCQSVSSSARLAVSTVQWVSWVFTASPYLPKILSFHVAWNRYRSKR